jgi:hypothetical protein
MIKSAAIKVNNNIYIGHRHFQIIPIALESNPEVTYITQDMQGFVTDNGEFVNREIAAKIAYECEQIKEAKHKLYSEDLY